MKSSHIQNILLATVCSLAYGQFEEFGGQKNCPAFKCDEEETPTPKTALKFTSTGCNNIGGGGFSMSGMGMNNQDEAILPCCDLYHSCVQLCTMTKAFCDNNFEKCMDSKCQSITNPEKKKTCETSVQTKKLMMQFSQCKDFNEGQQKNCRCVKNDVLEHERVKIVESFYNKYNPSGVSKVKALVEKSNDGKKFAGLIYQLLKKYPKSIKRVKDPQQKILDDIMNGKLKTNEDKEEVASGDEDAGERIEL